MEEVRAPENLQVPEKDAENLQVTEKDEEVKSSKRAQGSSVLQNLEPAGEEHIELTRKKYGEKSWKVRVLKFLHSWPVQWAFQLLLLLDVLGVIVSMYLESSYPDCRIILQDAVCVDGEEPECFNDEKYGASGIIQSFIDIYSLVILLLFLLDNILNMVILGLRKFFSNCIYTLDLFVTLISIAFEVTPMFVKDKTIFTSLKLLVIFRAWRFISLIYGLLQAAKEDDENVIFNLKERTEQLEDILKMNNIDIPPKMNAATKREAKYKGKIEALTS